MSRFVEGEDRRQPALLPNYLDDYVDADNGAVEDQGGEPMAEEIRQRFATASLN